MPENVSLEQRLDIVVSACERLDQQIFQTVDLIAGFGEEINTAISALARSKVERIGLGVRLVTRGIRVDTTMKIDSRTSFEPDSTFETRPGAIALYLEAFGEGSDRVYYEIRSNPGLCVLVDFGANDANLVRMETFAHIVSDVERFVGIAKCHDGIRLMYVNSSGSVLPGLDSNAFLYSFLQMVHEVAQRRSRFNRID